MKEYIIEGKFEPFIGGWFIDSEMCDALIEDFKLHFENTQFDEHRGYHRLSSSLMTEEVHHAYMDCVKKVFALYQKKYEWASPSKTSDWGISNPYNIQKYDPGYNYKHWHTETGGPEKGKFLRHLTFMTYLNDIERGGETEYLYQNLKVKPQKGLTLIWPAGWTHPHRGIPAVDEDKYIVTGWASYKTRC